MLNRRLSLHETFCDILGTRHAYFQPPSNIQMQYPAIVYSFAGTRDFYANDSIHYGKDCYEITVIDRDPESEVAKEIRTLPYCSFDRYYVSENLNCFTFTIYY